MQLCVPELLAQRSALLCRHTLRPSRISGASHDGGPKYSGRGESPAKEVPTFQTVRVESIPNDENINWPEIVLGNGFKGSIMARDKFVRVVNSHKMTETR
jgi:hypothetical protein